MSPPTNRQVRLAARPRGLPSRDDFTIAETPIPEAGHGEVLVRITHVSLDPAMRSWMNEGTTYIRPVRLGEVMRASTIGRVLESDDPKLPTGTVVLGMLGVQEYAVAKTSSLVVADLSLAPEPTWLGGLGVPGLTAYFGLFDVGKPRPGETVLVSAAAGAVGSVVGQLAKLSGCRAVGVAGGPDKCRRLVTEYGFDAAIDYRHDDLDAALERHCRNGVDVYFDNVGGPVLDAALGRLAMRGRVVLCGAVSQYNQLDRVAGPSRYLSLLSKRGRMEGFVVLDYEHRFAEARAQLAGWLRAKHLSLREHVVEGIDGFPEALTRLFSGDKDGKLVLKVG